MRRPWAGRRSRWAVVAIVAVAASGCGATPVPTRMPALPKLGAVQVLGIGDLGDPAMLLAGGKYYLFGTDDAPWHIPTEVSSNLVDWTRLPDAVPTDPAWADPDANDSSTWAPYAMQIGSTFFLYITVKDKAANRQCIAAMTSKSPGGPYKDGKGSPLICQPSLGGSIDPYVVSDDGLHLLWKSDGNCCGLPTAIWEQDLSPNGIDLTGQPHKIYSPDLAWQGGITENPAVIPATHGGWWLFYSGNYFDVTGYGTGIAWCPTLSGPCRDAAPAAVLSTGPNQFSPGGLGFFTGPHGKLTGVFATWNRPARNGIFRCCRQVDLVPVLSS